MCLYNLSITENNPSCNKNIMIRHEIEQKQSDEIDLVELFSALWKGKFLIFGVASVFVLISIFYSLSLPDIYESEVLLAPSGEQASKGIAGQLGGIAALAGMNLGSLEGVDKTTLALEIMKSRDFIRRFIDENEMLIPLMAVKEWNRDSQELLIDESLYDTQKSTWVRNVSPPYESKPSLTESYERFRKILTITQDKSSSLVNISIEHQSPYLAKEWVDKFVTAINEEMRERDSREAKKSLEYLNKQIGLTNIAELRLMLHSLIEEQMKTLMLANVREEYVFKTIDRAVVAEIKTKPSRALIVMLAALLGGMLSGLFVIIRHFSRK